VARQWIPGKGWVETKGDGGASAGQPTGGPRPNGGRPAGYRPPRSPDTPAPASSGSSGAGSYPGVSAQARAKAQKAQTQAEAYRKYQRTANKLKRKIKANSGPTDLAGRTQREIDLKRMRGIQKEADRRKALAQKSGLRMGGGSGASTPASGGSSGGGTPSKGTSTPRATASTAVARATGSQARPTANPTRPQAPKAGTVLAKAMALKDGGKGIAISADELAAFQKNYARTHKGKKLSRTHAVMMARYIKSRGGEAAKTYGLGKYEHSDG
jgi:hypothetical protein